MMKFAFLFCVVLLFSIVSVLGQPLNEQFSINGDARMLVNYDMPVVVRNDGLQAHFGHSFESRGVRGEWTLVTCPLPSRDNLPAQSLQGLSNVPIFSEAGNPQIPDFIDMSGGCLHMDFTAHRGDKFRIGQLSTEIEIQNGTAEFVITPEYVKCDYLACESFIEIHNLESSSISFDASYLYAVAEEQNSTTVTSVNLPVPVQIVQGVLFNDTLVNITPLWRDMIVERDVQVNDTLTIAAGGAGLFRVHSEFNGVLRTYKYNVSLFYQGVNYLVDPFFETKESNFSAGTFDVTFLNPGGWVQLPTGFGVGAYLSEIFDTQGQSNFTNMTWWQEVNHGAAFPDFLGNDTGHFVERVNMTGNVALFHFDNSTDENDKLVLDFSGNDQNLTCSPPGCPLLSDNSIFNRSYAFDGSNDLFLHSDLDHGNFDNESFSVGVWVNTTDPNNDFIVGKRDGSTGWEVGIRASSKTRFLIDEDGAPNLAIEGTTTVTDGTWHYVVGVRDTENAVIRIYVDGQEDAVAVDDGTVLTLDNAKFFSVGADGGGSAEFEGNIDEITLWDRALTAEEIRLHYLRGGASLIPAIRSCDDRFCFNDDWFILNQSTSTALFNLNFSDRYVQYNFTFLAPEEFFTPKLYNVSIGFETTETPGGLVVGECPTVLGNVLLLYIVVFLGLILIVLSFVSGADFFGVFGGLLLIITSWFLVGCSNMFGYSVALLGLMAVIYFAVRGFSGGSAGGV